MGMNELTEIHIRDGVGHIQYTLIRFFLLDHPFSLFLQNHICPGIARLRGFVFWAPEDDLAWVELGRKRIRRNISEVFYFDYWK